MDTDLPTATLFLTHQSTMLLQPTTPPLPFTGLLPSTNLLLPPSTNLLLLPSTNLPQPPPTNQLHHTTSLLTKNLLMIPQQLTNTSML